MFPLTFTGRDSEEEKGGGKGGGGGGGSWLALPMRWRGFAVGVFFVRVAGEGGREGGREGWRKAELPCRSDHMFTVFIQSTLPPSPSPFLPQTPQASPSVSTSAPPPGP